MVDVTAPITDAAASIACLCMAGVLIFNVMVFGALYSLYRYLNVVDAEDYLFRTLLYGVVFMQVASVLMFMNGTFHRPPFSIEYTPSLQTATLALEIVAIVLIFESAHGYLKRFTTPG